MYPPREILRAAFPLFKHFPGRVYSCTECSLTWWHGVLYKFIIVAIHNLSVGEKKKKTPKTVKMSLVQSTVLSVIISGPKVGGRWTVWLMTKSFTTSLRDKLIAKTRCLRQWKRLSSATRWEGVPSARGQSRGAYTLCAYINSETPAREYYFYDPETFSALSVLGTQ